MTVTVYISCYRGKGEQNWVSNFQLAKQEVVPALEGIRMGSYHMHRFRFPILTLHKYFKHSSNNKMSPPLKIT